MRQLEEENLRLKRQVADLSFDKAMLQDVLAKKSYIWPWSAKAMAFFMSPNASNSIQRSKHVIRKLEVGGGKVFL